MITLFFFELTEENCFGRAFVFHSRDMASLAQLHLKQDGLYVGQTDCLHFTVMYIIHDAMLLLGADIYMAHQFCSA